MKKESTASKQVIKPVLYILLYLLILILMIQLLTTAVSADKGVFNLDEKEIYINKNQAE